MNDPWVFWCPHRPQQNIGQPRRFFCAQGACRVSSWGTFGACFLHDVCHSQLLGMGKALNGSVLTYLCEAKYFGAWYPNVLNVRLNKAYIDFNEWKKSKHLIVTQPRFIPSCLSPIGRISYPSLGSKVVAGKALSFWFYERMCTWTKWNGIISLDKQATHCIWTYYEVLRIMDEADTLLTSEQGEALFTKDNTWGCISF